VVLADKLDQLGVRRLLLAIHEMSFPSDPDEDLGRGAPATRAAGRFMSFAKGLGFTGLQLGSPGQTSRDTPSPYEATLFSRNLATISVGAYEGWVPDAMIARAVGRGSMNHVHAYDASHALLAVAHAAMVSGARPELQAELDAFCAAQGAWLASDALYAAISAAHGGAPHRAWPAAERDLWQTCTPLDGEVEVGAQVAALTERHATAIDRYNFGQLLAHREHARVRRHAGHLGLALYGVLAVGCADADVWAYRAAFLRGYHLGEPPSRTNPAGHAWGLPVLDPAQLNGRAGELLRARAHKAFAEYDSLRIDHPQGLICPWVYPADTGDDDAAVRAGARLFESPDRVEHAAYALVGLEQLDHARPRYADAWVKALSEAQARAYAAKLAPLLAAARAHGRNVQDLSFEVLATMPRPLGAVLEASGCGRWRIAQKANLNDANDVYRMENAQRTDWVMLGDHESAPIFELLRAWPSTTRDAWARHLTERLGLARPWRLADPGFLANAMLAELLASRAENVAIVFGDLFGYGHAANWSLRLPSDFAAVYAERRAAGRALDLELATELALAAPAR
jgi:4-alpha-glucanotransferase